MSIKRGEIYVADLSTGTAGSEMQGVRPVLIIQNDTGNLYSPTVIVAPISSQMRKADFPTHVTLNCMSRASLDGLTRQRNPR